MSMGKRLLIGAAAALGFMALANMLGLGEGFAQMLMILTLILLAVVAFRFFAARKSGASAAASAGAPASQPTQDADFGQSRSEAAVREQPAFNLAQAVRPGSAMDQFSDEPAAASESTYGASCRFQPGRVPEHVHRLLQDASKSLGQWRYGRSGQLHDR